MDVPMYESQTGITLLQCVRNDERVEGGDTIIVDALAVAEKLRAAHPHHFSTLTRVPATFQRIHHKRHYPVHMVYRTPHIHLNGHGQIIKLRWAPQHEGPLQASEVDVEKYYDAHVCFAKALHNDAESKVHHRLEPGEMLVLNNHRMLHGRTAVRLNGGVRLFNNLSMNIDEFKSRLLMLCAQYDPDYQPKNILNHDFSFSSARD
jgi:gamma-butyrobetaine dioxygenase